MTVRPRTLIVVVLVVLLLTLGILAFPLLYDPAGVKQFLLGQVEQQLGRKIEVGRTRLEVFPRIRLELTDVVIRDLDPSQVFFTADRLDLVLRAYSLLRQQVVGKRLLLERPRLKLRRDAEGRWNFSGSPEQAGESLGDPLGLLLRIRDSTITDGQVVLIDEFRPDGPRSMNIDGLHAKLEVGPRGTQADLELRGMIATGAQPSTFMLAGRIAERAPTVRISSEEGGHLPALTFDGAAEANQLDIRQLADFFGPRPVPARVHGVLNVHGQISIAPGIIGYDMVLSKMKAEVERLSITGQASVSGLMAAQPTFSLTFSSSQISLDELLTRFPIQWLPATIQTALIERELAGSVEVVTATVTGSTTPQPRFSLTGEFQVRDGRMVVGQDRTLIQQLSGTVFVEPDRVRVAELSGSYGPMRITAGKALVSPLEVDPWLELEVRGELGAADLVATLAKGIKVPPIARGFAELSDVKGQSQIALSIGGSLKDPDQLRINRAEVLAQDVWLRTPRLKERIVDLNGRFLYSKTGVEFDKLGGRLGRTMFEIGGGISFGQPSLYQDFTVRARGEIAQILQMFELELPAALAWQGMASGSGILTGPVDSPRLKSVVDLRETDFSVPDWVHKPAGTSASIEFEGALGPDAGAAVDRLELVLPPFRLAAKGKVRWANGFAVDAALVSGPVSLAGLPQGMTVGPFKDGIIEVSLDVKGKGADWRAWQTNGWVALTDGLVAPKGVEHTLTDLYLRLKIMRSVADIKRLAFKIKESDVRLAGIVRNWTRSPLFNLEIESAQLDLDLLIPKGRRSPIRDFLELLAESSRVMAAVSIDRGVYKTLTFTGLTCRLNIKNGALDVDRISADTEDGHLAGRLVVALPRDKTAEVDVSYRVSGLPVEKLIEITGTESRMIVGSLSASGTFRGNDGDPLGFVHSLDGKSEFLLENGHIRKGTIVPKIITILNLPTLLQGKVDLNKDGFPFDRIIGSFSLSNGILTEDNLVIDSPVMKMSAAGNYDIADDHVNAVVVVSPFGSYSQLLKSIPLFGKLFKGEREGTALFEVKGSLRDPDVTYMPLRSFAKGMTGLAQLAFDVLRNTLMLPKEIVSPSDEPSDAGRHGKNDDRPEPRLP
ncbi:YhdP family protein [Candidatus Nitrospira bockiana]